MHSDCFSILDSSDPFAAFWPQGSEDEYPFGNLMLHANCLVTSHMKLFGRISKLKSPLRCFVSDKFGSATFLSNIPHSSSVALRLSSSMAFCTSASSRLASESLLGNEKSQCRLFWVKYIYIYRFDQPDMSGHCGRGGGIIQSCGIQSMGKARIMF